MNFRVLLSYLFPVRSPSLFYPGILWRGKLFVHSDVYDRAMKTSGEHFAEALQLASLLADSRTKVKEVQQDAWKRIDEEKYWKNRAHQLEQRIQNFLEQSRRVKEAYAEQVMICSHGQVDRRALTDPEKYLIQDGETIAPPTMIPVPDKLGSFSLDTGSTPSPKGINSGSE